MLLALQDASPNTTQRLPIQASKQNLPNRVKQQNTPSTFDLLQISQPNASILYKDNMRAFLMAIAQQPTQCPRHMDIKTLALLDWVEQDLILLHSITLLPPCGYNNRQKSTETVDKMKQNQCYHNLFILYLVGPPKSQLIGGPIKKDVGAKHTYLYNALRR
jgi:hypothetical protein